MKHRYRFLRVGAAFLLTLFITLTVFPVAGAQGYVEWTRQFGSVNNDDAYGAAANAQGVFVAGAARGKVKPDGNHLGLTDGYIRRYDRYGTWVWTTQFGTYLVDVAHDVAATSSYAYVVGLTTGTMGLQNFGYSDAFIVRFDAGSGNPDRIDQFGTQNLDAAFGVAVDASGVYVAGYVNGDPQAPRITLLIRIPSEV